MRKNPRRILSPQRLPFRHPGAESLSYIVFCELAAVGAGANRGRVVRAAEKDAVGFRSPKLADDVQGGHFFHRP